MIVKDVSGGHRARQAQATREQVARAARALFRQQGYVATTIAEIALAADIPAQTIYSSLRNKPGILAEILRLWIAESEVQRQHEQALAQPDPVRRLRMAAHWHRRQMELGYDVIAIYTEAARVDEVIAQAWRQIEAGRERAVTSLVTSLDGQLAAGLTAKTAVDLYLAATLAEAYSLLVLQRGWSLEQYESWLGDQLLRQLLG